MEPPFDITLFRQSLIDDQVIWRKHTLEKMLARGITRTEVIEVLESGSIIQTYDYDKPFPSVLILGFVSKRPIHVVASFDEENLVVFIITTYEPDLNIFEDDFKTKRK